MIFESIDLAIISCIWLDNWFLCIVLEVKSDIEHELREKNETSK